LVCASPVGHVVARHLEVLIADLLVDARDLRALAASVTTIQRQVWLLLAVGACIESRMQSRITSRSTGRARSRRLRTARVVESRRSVSFRSNGGGHGFLLVA
jgi:hypothetical protein